MSKIFPLIFKAGIKKDNTSFQGEYITDGDYVRWVGSYLRKMTGQTSLNLRTNLPIQLWGQENQVLQYFYAEQNSANANNIFTIVVQAANQIIYSEFNLNDEDTAYQAIANPLNIIQGTYPFPWNEILLQILPIKLPNIENTKNKEGLLFYFGQNLLNINSSETSKDNFYFLDSAATPLQLQLAQLKFSAEVSRGSLSGGIAWNRNYLFIYGANGQVLISSLNNPFNFSSEGKNQNTEGSSITIGTDKVIYGCPVRGGSGKDDYCMLFWTLSTLVLIESVTPDANEVTLNVQDTRLHWNQTIISTNTSILSNRCVVENNGLFYWIGTDGFYVYNGMVQTLANNINKHYFFNNLDISKRQLVYGVLYEKFNEIWWYYPEKINTSQNYNLPQGSAPNGIIECSRAIIYNLVEQTWYDVAITGTHGQNLPLLGQMFNLGIPKNYPPVFNYLFCNNLDKDITLNAQGLQNQFIRLLDGKARSNTGISLDGEGGGNANYAFNNNYLTSCVQQEIGGNISYTYPNPTTVVYVGLLYNDSNIKTKTYAQISIWGMVNSTAEQEQLFYRQNVTLISGIIYWIKIPNDNIGNYLVYQIEADINEVLELSEIYFYSTTNQNVIKIPIISYFTTPIMSFSTFSPLKENDGEDIWMKISRIEPDIKTIGDIANLSMVIDSKTYAQSPILRSEILNFTNKTDKITTIYQGRNVTFSFSSIDYFELGNFFFKAEKGAKQ